MSGQIILITGASRGIGLATAKHLAKQGHHVFGTSRHPQVSEDFAFDFIQLDVNETSAIERGINRLMDKFGRIDVLINNAGYDLYGEAEHTTFDEIFAQVNTNFLGVVRMTQAVLPIMRQQKSGKIINISSIGGLIALPFNSAYSASKFALEGYSESMRYELLQFGIYTSLIIASGIRTDSLDKSIQEISDTESPYYQQRQSMLDQMRQLSAESTLKPIAIAKRINKIINQDNPALRHVIGQQTNLLIWLKTILPQSIFEKIILNQFKVVTG